MILKKILIVFVHAFIGWALCGASIAIGQAFTSMENTLIIHAIASPIVFIILSFIYFTKFNHTSPFKTAFIFLHFSVFMDIFVVATIIEKNYAMFRSPIGTWIPLTLIFIVTFAVGTFIHKRKKSEQVKTENS
jgi:hypothetical protein